MEQERAHGADEPWLFSQQRSRAAGYLTHRPWRVGWAGSAVFR